MSASDTRSVTNDVHTKTSAATITAAASTPATTSNGEGGGKVVADDHHQALEHQHIVTLIETVLQQTQERFQTMSEHIIRRIDDMTTRVDDLEKNIAKLMNEANVTTTNTANSAPAINHHHL